MGQGRAHGAETQGINHLSELRYKEYGVVKSASGCITTIINLQNCFLGQLIKFGEGTEGIIMGFDTNSAQVLMVKERNPVTPGDRIVATLEPFNMPVGKATVGRIINPLGEPLDGMGPLQYETHIPYFNKAPAIMDRESLSRTFETGIKLIDSMLPLGKGQRSLILGDKMTGKTTVGTDIVLNQKGKNVICIYCGIGKTKSAMSKVVDLFKENGCFDYTIIMLAPASSSPGQQYLAPYAACAVGEYFMYRGGDVFVFFDDFTKHAWAYRELSLLMQVPPGRDSYPGDIFFLHSRMIERAAQLNKKLSGGSMTFIPVVELLEGDLTAYVPTNLVSMTDGQLFLNASLFNEGFRPAVDVGLSVSRVGSKVQWKATKDVSKSVRMEFIQFKELLRVSKLQAGGQSEEARENLRAGRILQAILTQPAGRPVDLVVQIMLFYGKNEGLFRELEKEQVVDFLQTFPPYAEKTDPTLFTTLRSKKAMDDEIKRRITKLVKDYIKIILSKAPKMDEESAVEVG
ncbi:MAG: F0F1 ATP synthase subunit alpha [Candidatus Omnitrophica bacterium]|nr:F0F1 ATP synthase subunit alpha [Candidatus Omnitrophota bacterium]